MAGQDIFEAAGFPARKPEAESQPKPGQDIFEAAGFGAKKTPTGVKPDETAPASFAERFAPAMPAVPPNVLSSTAVGPPGTLPPWSSNAYQANSWLRGLVGSPHVSPWATNAFQANAPVREHPGIAAGAVLAGLAAPGLAGVAPALARGYFYDKVLSSIIPPEHQPWALHMINEGLGALGL